MGVPPSSVVAGGVLGLQMCKPMGDKHELLCFSAIHPNFQVHGMAQSVLLRLVSKFVALRQDAWLDQTSKSSPRVQITMRRATHASVSSGNQRTRLMPNEMLFEYE